jgi:hypothetical protein
MYPSRELSRLAAHKQLRRGRICAHRVACVRDVARLARPWLWLDRALIMWRQLSPWLKIAAVPLGLLAKRSSVTRPLGPWLRWLPIVSTVARALLSRRQH